MPGLNADDLDIEVLNNTVTIRGEFKSSAQENAKYLLCELPSGAFSRVITLPTAVDAAKVEASIKNGVLTLQCPQGRGAPPQGDQGQDHRIKKAQHKAHKSFTKATKILQNLCGLCAYLGGLGVKHSTLFATRLR